MKAVRDFICLGSKITSDSDCSHKIKRHLLFGREAITNLESVLKSRGITFCHQDGIICISEVVDTSPGNIVSSL